MGASNFLSIRSLESIRRADGLTLAEPFPVRQCAVTFAAIVLAGAIPLLTDVINLDIASFQVAVALTLVALFVVGTLRATVADGGWLKNGVEMLTVGVLAATVSYAVVALVAPLTGG